MQGRQHHYEANVEHILEPDGRGVLQMLEYVGPERARQVLEQYVPSFWRALVTAVVDETAAKAAWLAKQDMPSWGRQ